MCLWAVEPLPLHSSPSLLLCLVEDESMFQSSCGPVGKREVSSLFSLTAAPFVLRFHRSSLWRWEPAHNKEACVFLKTFTSEHAEIDACILFYLLNEIFRSVALILR